MRVDLGGGDTGDGRRRRRRRRLPPGFDLEFPFLKIVEKSETPEKSFPLGCTRNLGLGFTLLKNR